MTSARDDEAHRDIVSVFIAPPSQRPILAALVDLSSAGLIAPFHWIEADADADVEGLAADPDLVSVSDGQVTASRYSHVVNRHGLRAVRLLVVVPVGHPAEDALTAETELYFHSLGITSTAERECTRVLVPWSPQPLEVELGRVGWNNVMLSRRRLPIPPTVRRPGGRTRRLSPVRPPSDSRCRPVCAERSRTPRTMGA